MRAKSINWPAVAAAMGRLIPPAQLHPAAMARADAELRRSRRRGAPARTAVAFSGGADSLALLLLLCAHGGGPRKRHLVALHFNHRLRGRAAAADERFCARVCDALGVPFVSGRWQQAPRTASEAASRAARYAFFGREMKRRKLRLLWLAHQQDDIAETLLMRLARGSGTGGLAAPRPVQAIAGVVRVRPLLTLRKAALTAALRQAGAVWREDATNASDAHFRTRIRQTVLPAWTRAAARDAVAGAALARERLEEDDVALEAWVDELAPLTRGGRLALTPLRDKPAAVWRRALHRWLLHVQPETDLSRQGFEQLLAAVRAGRATRCSLGRKAFAVVRDGFLRLHKC